MRSFVCYWNTFIMQIDKERRAEELDTHNKYIDAVEYCEKKNKTLKDKTECINMVMRPR